jgi:hypothetical protein
VEAHQNRDRLPKRGRNKTELVRQTDLFLRFLLLLISHLETFIIQVVHENLSPFPLLAFFAPFVIVMLVSDDGRKEEREIVSILFAKSSFACTHLCLCFLCSAGTIDFISPLNSDSICRATSYMYPVSYSS